MEPFAVGVEEAARLLGVKKSKTWQLVGSGELKSFRVGRARRVPVAAIRQWIAEQSGMQPEECGNSDQESAV